MTAPERMSAIEIDGGRGPADSLRLVQIETPKPRAGEILIRVVASGVNRPDVFQRLGAYPPPPGAPTTLGLEVAGKVAAVGEGAPRWRVGDQVCALLPGGGYAQYATVDARHALPIPSGLDMIRAAALPETIFTVFANVFELGELQAGQTLLLHGATSGIGVTAIAMAKAAGAKVIAIGRGADKAAAAQGLGADVTIDSKAEDFTAVARAHGGAHVVLDMVGGDLTPKNLATLNPGGRLVLIATQGGSQAMIDLADVMRRRLTITGSTLRPRSADEKARLASEIEAQVWPWIAEGRVRPPIDRTFPLSQAAQAHAWLEAGTHVGKVVLTAEEPT